MNTLPLQAITHLIPRSEDKRAHNIKSMLNAKTYGPQFCLLGINELLLQKDPPLDLDPSPQSNHGKPL